jgi:hypothetical protein
VLVNAGDGKGKSTAAFGIVTRPARGSRTASRSSPSSCTPVLFQIQGYRTSIWRRARDVRFVQADPLARISALCARFRDYR